MINYTVQILKTAQLYMHTYTFVTHPKILELKLMCRSERYIFPCNKISFCNAQLNPIEKMKARKSTKIFKNQDLCFGTFNVSVCDGNTSKKSMKISIFLASIAATAAIERQLRRRSC